MWRVPPAGHDDDLISNFGLLATNVFVWEAWGCGGGGGGMSLLVLRAFSTLALAMLFLVGMRLHWYRGHSLAENASTIAPRMLLIVIGLVCLTVFISGSVFAAARYNRETSGCDVVGAQTIEIGPNYTPLELGTKPGLPLPTAAAAAPAAPAAPLNVRFNASLLVGLHNSYHQHSPLAGVVQSWGYSHPALYDQLKLGYREIEIDVHWEQNGHGWKVFHVIMLDQRTSCSCLSDCLGQIRRWMDENKRASPILVHIEPRGYKYNDLFCTRSDGATRLAELQQQIFDLFQDRTYFPDELTAGYANAAEALAGRGWPYVEDMRGKIVWNLNLFSSNAACKALYFGLGGASRATRLRGSQTPAPSLQAATTPSPQAMARKRKLFFNRGTLAEARITNTTVSKEVTSSDVAADPGVFSSGFITRFRIGKEPEPSVVIRQFHDTMPATLLSYDGVWAG